MRAVHIEKDQKCPVCGSDPVVKHLSDPWEDYICVCPKCGFSYCELGDFGDTEEEAKLLWDWDVAMNELECVSCVSIENDILSEKWKQKREEYQKNACIM